MILVKALLPTGQRFICPYCTQDVFIGGGVDEDLGSFELPRYGSVNMRSAVMMFRDVLWKEMDLQKRQDFVQINYRFFGGWSAGAYGTIYIIIGFSMTYNGLKPQAFPRRRNGFTQW